MRSGIAAPGPKPMALRRRLAWSAAGLALVALLANGAATQFVAKSLHHHPALGLRVDAPRVGPVYPPWGWYAWSQSRWAPMAEHPLAVARFIAAAGSAFGLIVVLGLWQRRRRYRLTPTEDIHGTARFAEKDDLIAAGLLPRDPDQPHGGVCLGIWTDPKTGETHYLYHDGPENILGVGPPRSGKLVSIVMPTLLACTDCAVIYDEKGEIRDLTARWRERDLGQRVLVFEPGAATGSVCWNPLDEVRLGTEYEYRDVAAIVEMICDPDGRGLKEHFDTESASTLIGVALHTLYTARAQGQTAGFGDVLDRLSRERDALYEEMLNNQHCNGQPHPQIAQIGRDMLDKDIRERSGVHSTVKRMIRTFRDPIVARNMSRSDFRMRDLMNGLRKTTLYVVTPGETKLPHRPIVRLFFTMLFGKLMSEPMRMSGTRAVSPHEHRLLVVPDEFASLKRMEAVQEAMSKCTGYGIRVFPLIQDREQLLDAYGSNETVSSMCHIKVAFAPTNTKTADWLSDLSGTTTAIREDFSVSGSSDSTRRSWSKSYATISRRLITADEAMRLAAPTKDDNGMITAPGQVLIYVAGHPVALAQQALYFRDPEFLRRAEIGAGVRP